MNRRTVLKGLAAFPVASTMASCREDEQKERSKETPNRLQILLDGAFAVVLQHGKRDSVLAFSPRDKSQPHQFYFNDPSREQAAEKNYSFELLPEGIKEYERAEIDSGFSDFHASTKRWKLTESLVSIKLPVPKRISFAGHRERVAFKSGKTGWMPTNHILEYDVADPGRVRMECKELEKSCAPSADSPQGLMRFFFEVGPRHIDHKHAVIFFNDMLQASFPDLVAAYSLEDILDNRDEQQQPSTRARLNPAVMRGEITPQLQNVSYTLDCKIGGLLVDVSGPPG